jgi:hypothetical protein
MATERTIFTGLNKESFEKGINWVRVNKQTGLTLLVIDMGLNDSQSGRLKELGVKVVPNNNKTGIPQADLFNTFLACAENPSGSYLFWDMEAETEDITALWGASRLAAPLLSEVNIGTLVFPLTTIDARVKIGSRLETEVIEANGAVYYSGLMAGKLDEWKLFVGLYNNLVETGVVETMIPARTLVLNLFSLYFAGHVETKPVDYKISALQLANQE